MIVFMQVIKAPADEPTGVLQQTLCIIMTLGTGECRGRGRESRGLGSARSGWAAVTAAWRVWDRAAAGERRCFPNTKCDPDVTAGQGKDERRKMPGFRQGLARGITR